MSASDPDRTCEYGDADQCPNDRKPIFFMRVSMDDGRKPCRAAVLPVVPAIDVGPLGGTDTVSVNDMTGTDLERVDVDFGTAPGGSAGDGFADTVIVKGTAVDDSIAAEATGLIAEVSGLPALVWITHADPANNKLIIDTLGGADDVALDPAIETLIGVSVL